MSSSSEPLRPTQASVVRLQAALKARRHACPGGLQLEDAVLQQVLLWGACFDSDLFFLSWRCPLLSYILNSQRGYPSPS